MVSAGLALWRWRYHRPVRKLIKLAVVALGIRAFLRWRKGRHEAAQTTSAPPAPQADPADELRRKLAESRDDDVSAATDGASTAAVADRRADVHAEGRAALDEMTSSTKD